MSELISVSVMVTGSNMDSQPLEVATDIIYLEKDILIKARGEERVKHF